MHEEALQKAAEQELALKLQIMELEATAQAKMSLSAKLVFPRLYIQLEFL